MIELLRTLSGGDEATNLLEFLFQLTICLRGFPSDTSEAELEKCLRVLNEIHHRVLNRIRDIEAPNPWSDEEYVPEMVSEHLREAPVLRPYVVAAVERALYRNSE